MWRLHQLITSVFSSLSFNPPALFLTLSQKDPQMTHFHNQISLSTQVTVQTLYDGTTVICMNPKKTISKCFISLYTTVYIFLVLDAEHHL